MLILGILVPSCKKKDESTARLEKLANELNEGPDRELNNGTILIGCEYNAGDSLFTYIIKVSDNRFDKLEEDSIKRNFAKSVKSDEMTKEVALLNKANVGLKYRLKLQEKDVEIEFPHSEISIISGQLSK